MRSMRLALAAVMLPCTGGLACTALIGDLPAGTLLDGSTQNAGGSSETGATDGPAGGDADGGIGEDADGAGVRNADGAAVRDADADANAQDQCTPQQPCVALPMGWQPYALVTTDAGCPSGFTNPTSYVASASGVADTCSCSCSGTAGCAASVTINQFTNVSCSLGEKQLGTATFTQSCTPPGSSLTITYADSYEIVNNGSMTEPGCSGTASVTSTPPVVQAYQSLCPAELTCPGGACLNGVEQASLCVVQAGSVLCPNGYGKKTLLATGIADTRGCGPCACASTLGCTLTSVLVANDSACGNGGPNLSVNVSECLQSGINFAVNGVRGTFSTSGSAACSTVSSPSQPEGGVSLDPQSTVTVCCP